METKIEVGMKLYAPDPRRSSYWEYDVVSIGRKWIQLSKGQRCDFRLLLDCGGYAPRQLYTDIAAYEADRKLSAAWSDLCRDIQRMKRPADLTVDDIDGIRQELGLQVLPREALA